MAFNTAIHWTNRTQNFWVGCQKVSQGCKHCYMFRDMRRYGKDPREIRRTADKNFYAPLKWKEPALVFTCSYSDFMIEEADPWRDDAWDVIRKTPHLTYQILTKRPERIAACLPADWGGGYPNVWLGVSVEDQENADKRIPILKSIRAQVRFLSCEPLLGPVSLDLRGRYGIGVRTDEWLGDIDWVIAGGESGPDYRPMQLDWVRSIRDQCSENSIAFFFKQVGGNRKVGDVWGGDLLDGVQYNEWPKMPTPQPPATLSGDQMSLL